MTVQNRTSKALVLLSALLLVASTIACGGSGGSPSAPTVAQGPLTLQLHSGKELVGIGSSVSGMATAGTASRQVQNGEASFESVMVGSPLKFTGNGFVNWNSVMASPGTLSAYLWPNDSFLSESDIRAMAFSSSDGRLRRAVGDVYISLGDFAGDEGVRSSFVSATALLNGAIGDGARFLVSDSPPAGAVVIVAKHNPNLSVGQAGAACGFDGSFRQVGGSIYYISRAWAANTVTPAHEMAHCFGMLGHNPKTGGIMNANALPGGDFSLEEKVVLRMMTRLELGRPLG